MNYFLSLELPLYWLFLPLIVAGSCAYKYYQVRYILRSGVSELKRNNSTLQSKLEAALTSEKSLRLSASQNLTQLKDTLAKLHKLETDATEREALIVQLRKDLTTENEILSERLADKNSVIEQLQSKLQLSELAHNETKADLEGLEQQFTEALSVINRTVRGRKQWDKIVSVKQALESNKTSCEIEVTHDSLGVPTVTQADQSEDFNARHIKELGSEVARGIQEQNAAIRKELQQVDMSTLEVGDSVVFRNNDVKVVTDILIDDSQDTTIPYRLICGRDYFWFRKNGRYATIDDAAISKKDIVQIIKQPKFDPQVGEKVGIVDSSREFTVVEIGKNKNGYLLRCRGMMHQYKPIQDITPLPNHIYKNGFVCTK